MAATAVVCVVTWEAKQALPKHTTELPTSKSVTWVPTLTTSPAHSMPSAAPAKPFSTASSESMPMAYIKSRKLRPVARTRISISPLCGGWRGSAYHRRVLRDTGVAKSRGARAARRYADLDLGALRRLARFRVPSQVVERSRVGEVQASPPGRLGLREDLRSIQLDPIEAHRVPGIGGHQHLGFLVGLPQLRHDEPPREVGLALRVEVDQPALKLRVLVPENSSQAPKGRLGRDWGIDPGRPGTRKDSGTGRHQPQSRRSVSVSATERLYQVNRGRAATILHCTQVGVGGVRRKGETHQVNNL